MSETKLLSCPFCGGKAEIHSRCNYYETGGEIMFFVSCNECKAESTWRYEKRYAIKSWNTRKPMDDIVKRLEEESYDSMHLDMSRDMLETWQIIDFDKAIEIIKAVINK